MGSLKYPVYIISKGRYENPLTAKSFINDKINFKIFVEPQEYSDYCQTINKKYVEKLPFSNLGLGSYPARNHVWEISKKKRHWVFDDNIRGFRRLYKGKRIPCNGAAAIKMVEEFTDRYLNIGITGFNYTFFTLNDTSKPFYLNVHAYSAMLIRNDLPFRWRMKYNEDIDLCLQVLNTKKLCTVLFNAFMAEKMSTTAKMKGGNQDELYKGNADEKKILKARSLEEMWPQYVKTVWKFNRPHHEIPWKKHFKQQLIRDPSLNWNLKKINNFGLKLTQVKPIKSESLRKLK